MKKAGIVGLSLVVALLAGCSSSKSSQEEPEMTAARQCSDQVLTASKNKTGTTKLTSLIKDEATIVRVGDSSQETHLIKGFPYVESTALDNGTPGSTWRSCMQVKGFNVGR
ncbi:hypothetical protein QNN86_20580 [Citrobacter sp. C348]|uniref:hypothetical protein n=1 Tax=unclassified Citrobacter TaxID=2644389 RepID=UPI0025772ABB|nr:hypothetical protein [Citrobacter sp. Cb028]MDM3452137.1 hypothetical protein [Citrobacter sp. Cb028]HEM7419292.1 hypothetical protein [Citrobacter youngae]